MAATLKTTVIQEPSSGTVNMTLGSTGGVTFGSSITSNTITSAASTALNIQSAGTTAMTIDTSQNVGIGTTSPSTKLSLGSGSSNVALQMNFGTATGATVVGLQSDNSFIINQQIGAPIILNTSNAERMRIDSSGNLLVNTTTNTDLGRITVAYSTGVNNGIGFVANSTVGMNACVFRNPNGGVGAITTSGSATTYSTSSDYRLKENVTPMTTGLATIAALKPVNYDWISDKSAGEGFIAHELQAVIPHAVVGEKDAVNDDGSIKPQGVDYSKIVVHLVAALQELSAKVDAQAAEITALKAKVGA